MERRNEAGHVANAPASGAGRNLAARHGPLREKNQAVSKVYYGHRTPAWSAGRAPQAAPAVALAGGTSGTLDGSASHADTPQKGSAAMRTCEPPLKFHPMRSGADDFARAGL